MTTATGNPLPPSGPAHNAGFQQRFQDLVARVGGLAIAGELAGVTDETIGKWRDGKTKPTFFGLAGIAAAAGVTLDWLLTGAEHPRALAASDADVEAALPEFALLPRYSVSASAGSGLVAHEEVEIERIAFRRDWLRDMGLDPNQAGLLSAKGDSMHPTIPDGAMMLVDRRLDQPIVSGYIYVIVLDGEVLVKRVSRNVDATFDLISDNPIYPVQKVRQPDFDKLMIAGRVFWVGRTI
ncbi:Phage repressor protein C, contains Cro/C1-type HTH and peptisase s24 domains [Devosia enhydra]|uniref:Phage repressor protein C, contains Cro/C1-type HTH and peptisase s24 domains n=1 Tax=Devosia enhydra TaxID=665118 RepID=A0A1K2I0W3_9HYPH|nr:S24 family peptidase [Devosia enhydra]SFZ85961.1 Phage repressor protein C, contains Cro/C1-type HTH and peptisase s24 domains [Devosia enhydra]